MTAREIATNHADCQSVLIEWDSHFARVVNGLRLEECDWCEQGDSKPIQARSCPSRPSRSGLDEPLGTLTLTDVWDLYRLARFHAASFSPNPLRRCQP